MKYEIVIFETEDHEVKLSVETVEQTVWLTKRQMLIILFLLENWMKLLLDFLIEVPAAGDRESTIWT